MDHWDPRDMSHVRHLDLSMGSVSGAQWAPNDRLRGSFLAYNYNPHVGGGFNGKLLSSNVIQVAVVSGWNGLYGSMGPKGHVGHLDSVMGAMPSPQWVPIGGLRWSFLAESLHVGRGIQWPLMAYMPPK